MTNTAKDLTVVITTIPTRRDRLEIALNSVRNQTLLPADIIIQDDVNKLGAPFNRDAGLARVNTPYVAFLDDDDYFYVNHLETLYTAIKEEDADIVYSWFDVIGGTDPFPMNFGKEWDPENPVQTTVTTLCKTKTVRDAGGFSNTIGLNEEELTTFAQGNTVGEDFRMVLSANSQGAKIVHVPQKTWAYCHWVTPQGKVGNTSGMPSRWDARDAVKSKIAIIVPSRERPDNAKRLLEAVTRTASGREVDVIFAVDQDDPTKKKYPKSNTQIVTGGSMVAALNEVAVKVGDDYGYLAFLGDDTLPHDGWYEALTRPLFLIPNSIVYGNDLIHGEGLPTSVFMDSNIVRTLGYMAPPNQKQLFVDNYWKALGEALGTLYYVPDAIIEHLHPLVGKAPSDASYALSNSVERWRHDEEAFVTHLNGQHLEDLAKLR